MKIEINDNTAALLKKILEKSSFRTLGELVAFILEDYVKNQPPGPNDSLDEDLLRDRLKSLGYL